MFREDNSSFLFFQRHLRRKLYFHCVFIIYFIFFYVNDPVVLTKKKAISPRLLCSATVISAFHHCTKKLTKCFKAFLQLSNFVILVKRF